MASIALEKWQACMQILEEAASSEEQRVRAAKALALLAKASVPAEACATSLARTARGICDRVFRTEDPGPFTDAIAELWEHLPRSPFTTT